MKDMNFLIFWYFSRVFLIFFLSDFVAKFYIIFYECYHVW